MLKINNLCKSFGDKTVLDKISLTVQNHEIVCLMGKSGVGKTTLLRCLNQLETMDSGIITLDNLELKARQKRNKELQNAIGLVFQNYNLFPNYTVLENCIDAPIYQKLLTKEAATIKAKTLLNEMGILEEMNSRPQTLSGGQKQRVAIVRACMLDPKILCFDEPTSALDSDSTEKVAELIKSLAKKEMGILIVTHDEKLANSLNARIVNLNGIS